MRTFLVAALLLSSVFALPAASAKAFADDPQGDVTTEIFGAPAVPGSAPGADAADLLAMEVQEDAEKLVFVVQVTKLEQQYSFAQYQIHFSWQKTDYTVAIDRQVAQGVIEDDSSARLYSDDEENGFDSLAQLEHTMDVAKGTITVQVPKAYILSDKGKFPLLGDELKDVYVEAASHATLFSFTADSYDRMPDSGELKYPFLFGDLAAGHIRLDADERVRVSNGGATTFVYRVTVSNKGEVDDSVDLSVHDLPPEWNATVQTPLRIPGGAERSVAVLVSVPFAHEHGGFSSFNLTATSQRDAASAASVRMGVLHTPIPQPAGHHSELYLHAENFNAGIFGDVFPFTQSSMNTESVHDADAPEAGANFNGDGLGWAIPLTPGLRMGMDFDLERTGTIAGAIIGHQAQGTGSLSGTLYLVQQSGEGSIDWSEGVVLGETDAQDLTFDLNTPQPFSLTLTPTEDADYIPYARGQNLVLLLTLDSGEGAGNFCCLPGTTPGLTTADFKMTLPLNEYHDKLNGLAEAGDMLEIKAGGPVEKTGLPGTTMTYAFTLVNHGASEETIDLDLAGTDALLGTLVPNGAVTLGSKETRELTLAVNIPTGKNDGEELEVLIFAHAQEDPSKSAIARTKTVIGKPGSGELAADETGVLLAAQEREEKDSPGPGALVALAGIGAALLLARRKKQA
ncbi:MAG TPA: hypothetical protein VM370_12470 [Candidatus Thermoplasmatota archaeon]|nr:hypothetical protein [Candidatus Thermoplasmatota archaeon]